MNPRGILSPRGDASPKDAAVNLAGVLKQQPALRVAAFLFVLPAIASASGDIPEHFVSESECLELTSACECEDVPEMNRFLQNQEAAKSTWVSLRSQTQQTGTPATPEEVDDAFAAGFNSDPAVRLQFESCEDFDPQINDAGRIAGGALSGGGALLDPCYCKTFCREIIESTIAHERAHLVFNLGVIGIYASVGVACKAGLFEGHLCDGMDALAREGSEVYAYGKGNAALRRSIEEIIEQSPGMDCTTETPVENLRAEPSPEIPSGFLDRLRLLGERFFDGR